MGPRSGETTYIIAASVVEGYGLSGLGESEDGCGAILRKTEAKGEDAQRSTFEVGGI